MQKIIILCITRTPSFTGGVSASVRLAACLDHSTVQSEQWSVYLIKLTPAHPVRILMQLCCRLVKFDPVGLLLLLSIPRHAYPVSRSRFICRLAVVWDIRFSIWVPIHVVGYAAFIHRCWKAKSCYAETHGNHAASHEFDGIFETDIHLWRRQRVILLTTRKRGFQTCFQGFSLFV